MIDVKLPDLTSHWIVVTGGNGHLGSSFVRTLRNLNANVLIVDKQETARDDIASDSASLKSEISYYKCDLEIEEERTSLATFISSSFGRVDSLVNNAAFVGDSSLSGWSVPFEEQSLNSWRKALEVNVTAPFHLSQLLAPLLSESDVGTIVNISSIYAQYGPDMSMYKGTDMSNPLAYGVSKAGLEQLTRSLATVLSPLIRVNAISPGGIYRNQDELFVKRYVEKTPLKRMAVEDDLQWALIYLCTSMSSHVTGQVLAIDGGYGVW